MWRYLLALVTISVAALCLAAGPKPYTGKPFLTYPMPPPVKPSSPMDVHPGTEVPQDLEGMIWTVTAPRSRPDLSGAPVFLMSDDAPPRKIGTLAFGTTLKLEQVRKNRGLHFYAIPWKEGQKAWISGLFIAPIARAATTTP